MWTAFDTESKEKRIELARKALEICPDCADAYVVLSDELPSHKQQERIQFLEEGVKAGIRALEPNVIKESDGWLWGLLEARPYLRVRYALAVELYLYGRTDEAITHFGELLRLNKNDNQGVRYLLAPLLVSLDRLAEAEKLIKQYPDDVGPDLNYSHALLLFKKSGDTEKAREVLGEAVRWNRHVIFWLLTTKLNRKRPIPDHVIVGGNDEAYGYARWWRESWHKTKGAIDWVIETLLSGYQEHNQLYVQTLGRTKK